MSTIGSLFRSFLKEHIEIFSKQFVGKWMNGNDSFYYYVLSVDTSFKLLKSDGKNILDKINLSIKDVFSFEEISGCFLDELNIILSKAYLTGVYVKKKKTVGYYKFKEQLIDIMEET